MFSLIKGIIWIVGFVVVTIFVLEYFGYEINRNYFTESKANCLKKIAQCQKEYIHQGIDNAQCDFDCVDPKLIISSKKATDQSSSSDAVTDHEVISENTAQPINN